MVARYQLDTMNFNQSQNLEQTKTKDGVNRANVCSSKMTKIWTVKPIKEAILFKFGLPNSRSSFKEREI